MLQLIPFKAVYGLTPTMDRVQTNVKQFADSVLQVPLLDGALIEDITLNSSTDVLVSHRLGRTPRGWIVIKKNANADVWENSTSLTTRFIALRASGAVTVSLWVF